MEYLTIKETPELKRLAEFIDKPVSEVVTFALNKAKGFGYIIDDTEYANTKLFPYLIKDGGFEGDLSVEGAAIVHFGTVNTHAIELISGLLLWGTSDCPECGCESEESEDNVYVQIDHDSPPELAGYEYRVCLNCNHEFKI